MATRTIRYKLRAEEAAAFDRFMDQLRKDASPEELIQLTPEVVAKQCLFLSINEAYTRAKELDKQMRASRKAAASKPPEVPDVSTSGNSQGDTTKTEGSGSTDSNVLPRTKTDATDSGTV